MELIGAEEVARLKSGELRAYGGSSGRAVDGAVRRRPKLAVVLDKRQAGA